MKKKLKRQLLYPFITLLGALAFLLFFYGEALLSPNSYLFSGKGDGVKNYFTFASHLKNNKSVTNFEGFNYPYGENFLYTDGHPLLIVVLQPIVRIFPNVSNYSIGLLNSLMLLSLLLSAYVLFLLLRELNIHHFLAVLGAWAILILAPQIFRLEGHFALSYSFVIPLCFLWLLRYLGSTVSTKYLIYLSVFHALLLFIHAYLGIISIAILIAFFLVDGAITAFKKKQTWLILGNAIISMIPFLAVKAISDSHDFRTDNPYGFFEYYADVDTILLPHHGPFKNFIFNLLPGFTQTWEGWAYLGIGTLILLPFGAWHFFKNFRKTETFALNKIALASCLLLIFSFGIPFRWGLENILEYVPILKQFRAIGRFAWVFYFAVSIYAFYLLNLWIQNISSTAGKVLLTLSLPVLMIVEGLPYHSAVAEHIQQEKNNFAATQLNNEFSTLIHQLKPNDFQAIVPIPFYNIGSENYEKQASNELYLNSMLLAHHTGLPLTSSYLTRISLEESRNAMQFFAPNFYPKAIQNDLPSALPFLVIWDKNEQIEQEEQHLLHAVQWLGEFDSFKVGWLAFDAVFEFTAQKEINAFLSDTMLINSRGFLVSDSSKFFYFEDLNKQQTEKSFYRNDNYLEIDQQQRNELAVIRSSKLDQSRTYQASVWLSNDSRNAGQDDLNHLEFVVEEKNENEEVLQIVTKEVMSTFIHFKGESLIQLEFSPSSDESKLEFYLYGNSPQPNISYADGFFIRDTDLNVFRVLEGSKEKPTSLFKNNHSIKTRK